MVETGDFTGAAAIFNYDTFGRLKLVVLPICCDRHL